MSVGEMLDPVIGAMRVELLREPYLQADEQLCWCKCMVEPFPLQADCAGEACHYNKSKDTDADRCKCGQAFPWRASA